MKQIRLSGSGGQGVITAAIILAETAIAENKEAVQFEQFVKHSAQAKTVFQKYGFSVKP